MNWTGPFFSTAAVLVEPACRYRLYLCIVIFFVLSASAGERRIRTMFRAAAQGDTKAGRPLLEVVARKTAFLADTGEPFATLAARRRNHEDSPIP